MLMMMMMMTLMMMMMMHNRVVRGGGVGPIDADAQPFPPTLLSYYTFDYIHLSVMMMTII